MRCGQCQKYPFCRWSESAGQTECDEFVKISLYEFPEKKYIEEKCSKCINKKNNNDLCNIRMRLDGNYGCVNFKKKTLIDKILGR